MKTKRLLLALIIAAAPLNALAVEVGHQAPDFTLPNFVTGEPTALSDYSGKVVILIWFAHF